MESSRNRELLEETYDLLTSYRSLRNRTYGGWSLFQRLAVRWPKLQVLPLVGPPEIPFGAIQEHLVEIEERLHEIQSVMESKDPFDEVDTLLETYAEKVKYRALSLREQCALLQARRSGKQEYHFQSHPYMSAGGFVYTADTSYRRLRKLRSSHHEAAHKCELAGRELNDALDDPPDFFRNKYGLSDAFREEFGV